VKHFRHIHITITTTETLVTLVTKGNHGNISNHSSHKCTPVFMWSVLFLQTLHKLEFSQQILVPPPNSVKTDMTEVTLLFVILRTYLTTISMFNNRFHIQNQTALIYGLWTLLSVAQLHRARWYHDSKSWIRKEVAWSSCVLFWGTAVVFAWQKWEDNERPLLRRPTSSLRI
jgi:hypothetical protein